MQKEQDSSKIDKTGLQYYDLKIEYDHMATKVEALQKKTFMLEAEINDLRACIKPEGYDVNDDATAELVKADLLRVATKALADIRKKLEK